MATPLDIVENIEKPTTDKRKYRYVRLSNGLQALLVSEDDADMSAAALDVNVGSFFDPEEAQGLAHFCEHMLFLGSAPFPSESEYANYIKQHGGMHNACTEQTHTTFFFSVAAAHLQGALERFAAFFISPLFTATAAAREAQAVDSEFRLRRANDAVRRWHLLHRLSNPKHPFSHFSCGNISSLTAKADLHTGLRQLLLQFYNKWYSANIMTLTVLGRESLDDLQRVVQSLFEGISNKRVPTLPSLTLLADVRIEEDKERSKQSADKAPEGGIDRREASETYHVRQDEKQQGGREGDEDKQHRENTTIGEAGKTAVESDTLKEDEQRISIMNADPLAGPLPVFRPGIDLEKVVYVMPVKDFKEIHFQFVLPPLLTKWRSKPARFIGHLIGHEGRGSLLAALKKHALASGLNTWCLEEECISIFHISVELTELGISDEGLDRVAQLVLRYVQLLRTQPPAEWLFREKQELAKLHFLFADKEDAFSFCAAHAKRLHIYPPQQALSGAHLFFTYDAAEVQHVLQHLTLDHLRVEVVGKRFEEKCNAIEKIYGISYGVHDVPVSQRSLWEHILSASRDEAVAAAAAEGLHFPLPNPFIPTDLSLRSAPPEKSKTTSTGSVAVIEVAASNTAAALSARACSVSAAGSRLGYTKESSATRTAEEASAAGEAPAAGVALPAGGSQSLANPGDVTAEGTTHRKQLLSANEGTSRASATQTAALPVELHVDDFPALAGKTRFFFKQDDTFFLPKLSVRLWVSTAYSARGVREWILSWVYVDTVAVMLNEELYDAEIAGLFYSLSSGDWPGEVSVALHGFSHKLPLMLHKLTYALAHRGHTQGEEEGVKDSQEDAAEGDKEKKNDNAREFAASRSTTTADALEETGSLPEGDDREDSKRVSRRKEERKTTSNEEVGRSSDGNEKEGGRGRNAEEKDELQRRRGKCTDGKMGLDRNMYEVVKESLLRRLKNRLTYRTVYQQAMTLCGEALEDPFYSYEEQIAALEAIQFNEVEAVADQLFHRAHVEGLAVGNMREQECLHMLSTAVQNLNIQETGENLSPKAVLDLSSVDFYALASEGDKAHKKEKELWKPTAAGRGDVEVMEEKRKREDGEEEGEVRQPSGHDRGHTERNPLVDTHGGENRSTGPRKADQASRWSCKGDRVCVRVQQKNPNPEDYNNAAFLRLQLGELGLRERAMLALLSHWLEQPFFDEMRTQQQLGYVTQASKNVQLRTHTLDFFIASKYPPSLLLRRMEVFLKTRLFSRMEQLQEEFSEDLFELHRRALISELSVKPQNIYEETQRYVVEIYFKSFLFDRYAQTVKQLELLTRDECLLFIRHTLSRAPSLVLWIYARQHPEGQPVQEQKEETRENYRLLSAGSDETTGEKRSVGTDLREEEEEDVVCPRMPEDIAAVAREPGAAEAGNATESTAGGDARAVTGLDKDRDAAEPSEAGAEEGKAATEIARKKGKGESGEETRASARRKLQQIPGGSEEEGTRNEEEKEAHEGKTETDLETQWIDVANPRRLRDFASKKFVVPPW